MVSGCCWCSAEECTDEYTEEQVRVREFWEDDDRAGSEVKKVLGLCSVHQDMLIDKTSPATRYESGGGEVWRKYQLSTSESIQHFVGPENSPKEEDNYRKPVEIKGF